MFLNQTFNAIFQVVLFSIIPFFWWLITARKKESFWSWIGLKKVKTANKGKFLLLFAVTCALCYGFGELAIFLRGEMAAADSAYKGLGLAAVPSILMYAFVQTALSEEILFRGFLLKRLQAKWGFTVAVIVQAIIFGALHLLMAWGHFDLMAGIVLVVYPMCVAVVLSWLNENKANGSILPSWILHGILNSVTGILQALL